jgi:predicted nucleic acid-binding protein
VPSRTRKPDLIRIKLVIFYLDSNFVIYRLEQLPGFGPRALAHMNSLKAAGHTFAVSDLVRMECRMQPTRKGDLHLLGLYDTFFSSPDVQVLGLTGSVCDRATLLRAKHNFHTVDSIQLAAAIVHGCDRFLTADARLTSCTDIQVDLLP